jgi:hypothetical protein
LNPIFELVCKLMEFRNTVGVYAWTIFETTSHTLQ